MSCNNNLKIKKEILTCDKNTTTKLEEQIIEDLKINLANDSYQKNYKKIEDFWLDHNVLTSNNNIGYIQLLNTVSKNGFLMIY